MEEFDNVVERLIQSMKVSSHRFDTTVKININLFEGYTPDEQCSIFGSLNQYHTKFTESDRTAYLLVNKQDFVIHDLAVLRRLLHYTFCYWKSREHNEALICFHFDETKDKLSANDFLISMQCMMHDMCNLIPSIDGAIVDEKLPLIHTLFSALYGDLHAIRFTTETVNNFILRCQRAVHVLTTIHMGMFQVHCVRSFAKCKNKLFTLGRTHLVIVLLSIVHMQESTSPVYPETTIVKEIEKAILYHLLCREIKDDNLLKKGSKEYDIIAGRGTLTGSSEIQSLYSSIKRTPNISANITRGRMETVLRKLIRQAYVKRASSREINRKRKRTTQKEEEEDEEGEDEGKEEEEEEEKKEDEKYTNGRRIITFVESLLMYIFYRRKMPTEHLDHSFHTDHIVPISTTNASMVPLTRLGNLVPVTATMNWERGNQAIDVYYTSEKATELTRFLKELLPTKKTYASIVLHVTGMLPQLKAKKAYGDMCDQNENIYVHTFLSSVYCV